MAVDREARLKEVLAEITLLDVGQILKLAFLQLGCLGGVMAVALAANAVVPGDRFAGFSTEIFWFVVAWLVAYESLSNRSFHEGRWSFYFPKVGLFSSLFVATYAMCAFWLITRMPGGEDTGQRMAKALAILALVMPAFLTVALMQVGHGKLMQRREQEKAPSVKRRP